jgi:hypothetical protein
MKKLIILIVVFFLSSCAQIAQKKFNNEVMTINSQCNAKYESKEFKTRLQTFQQCTRPQLTASYNRYYGNANIDLFNLLMLKRQALTERVDKKRLSESEGELQYFEYESMILSEVNNRALQAQQINAMQSQSLYNAANLLNQQQMINGMNSPRSIDMTCNRMGVFTNCNGSY